MTPGHTTTPLAQTLGYKPGMRAFIADMPEDVRAAIGLDSLGLELLAAPSTGIDAAHIFVTSRERLDCQLNALRQLIAPGGFIWVSWPEDGDGDVSKDATLEIAALAGLSEVKSCPIGESWSALKLMVGKELR